MNPLLSLNEALTLIGQVDAPLLGQEPVALEAVLGRVLARDVTSPADLPAFDNSSVDGYALAGPMSGSVSVTGQAAAGFPWSGTLKPGQAARILTGAIVPQGADRVVMQEVCTREGDALRIETWPEAGACIRRTGQDLAAGTRVLPGGRRLGAPEIAMLAALGFQAAEVRIPPLVIVFSTGSELSSGETLQPGQIRDANRPLLKSLLAGYPVRVEDGGVLPDDPELTKARLREAAGRAQLILTTGGVSVGDHDHVRDVLHEDGTVIFWRLAMRPGKPLLFGQIGETYLLGLPGNPVSAGVTFQLAGRPLLHRLAGLACRKPLAIPATLACDYTSPPALREFIRVTAARDGATITVTPFRSQVSNLISSLLESDGLLDLPAGVGSIRQGEAFDFYPWSSFTAG